MPPDTNRAVPSPIDLEVHHIGIVVTDEARMDAFAQAMNLVEIKREHLPKYHVTNVFFESRSSSGGPLIQFAIPTAGTLRNFNRGAGGFHHVAFKTDDVERAQRAMEAAGMRFIATEPQIGVDGLRFNFVSPNVQGLNVEIVEEPSNWRTRNRVP
jgi:methylmalonyl-CoA/ethylmalonyl-CoA epimerase